MNKKTYVALLILCIMTGLLGACGTKETDVSDATNTTEVSTEAATVVSSESTTEEEIIDKPWAEENNITFSVQAVEVPCYSYVLLPDGTSSDEIKVTQVKGLYHIPTVTVSDSDKEGYVIYDIQYKISVPYYAEGPVHLDDFRAMRTVSMFSVMDYYTGTVFPSSSLTDDNDHSFELSTDVDWEGNLYSVSIAHGGKTTSPVENFSYIDDTRWKYEVESEMVGQIKIVAPKGYDGLVLSLNLNGKSSDSTSSEINAAHKFGEDGETTENRLFIRLSDLITE